MRWQDFFRPEAVIAVTAKLVGGLFAFVIFASTVLALLRRTEISTGDFVGFVVGWLLLSGICYAIRERRNAERPRLRSTRGAERTPLLPRVEEEE